MGSWLRKGEYRNHLSDARPELRERVTLTIDNDLQRLAVGRWAQFKLGELNVRAMSSRALSAASLFALLFPDLNSPQAVTNSVPTLMSKYRPPATLTALRAEPR